MSAEGVCTLTQPSKTQLKKKRPISNCVFNLVRELTAEIEN